MVPEGFLYSDNASVAGRAPDEASPSTPGAQPGDALASPDGSCWNREEVECKGSGETAGGSPGGDPSNTPPSITKCSGGEDWLELCLYLQHNDFPQLKERLDAAREAAESNQPDGNELEIAGRKFLMLPSAAIAGTGEKRVCYRWRLRSEDGWWLFLMNRAAAHKTLPTGMARASSLPLMQIGPQAFLRQLQETLDDLGIDLICDKLSRVDACADLTDVSIDNLYQAFVSRHYVSPAKYAADYAVEETMQGHRFGRRPTGFAIGKCDVRLRVYDKLRKSFGDSEMLALMQTRRWGGLVLQAIRVEFELRREKLKSLGVDSVFDWFEKRGSITRYLSHDWFRMIVGKFDPQHPDRSPTLPDWMKVQEAFAWAGEPVSELLPLPRLPIHEDRLLKQAIGALVSYHARMRTVIDGNESFIHESFVALLDRIKDRDMAAETARKALELGVARRHG